MQASTKQMKGGGKRLGALLLVAGAISLGFLDAKAATQRQSSQRPRVIVSTDVGGTDPDDFQSLVHLLVYADLLELEGLVSSPPGLGRREHIIQVIDAYERDYENLRTHSQDYPTPAALRGMSKQGATEPAPYAGVRGPTEGSDWIVARARRKDPRPLNVLVWGGIEDLAQALHDAPDILPQLRVYYIGGPNKKWSPDAYQRIIARHRKLWIIEANSTYRGFFVGGNQGGGWGNEEFVARHIAGNGALGDHFASHLGGGLKMGDSPSVCWLLKGNPSEPALPGWGGRFVRAWDRPLTLFRRLTTATDEAPVFGIVEFNLPIGANPRDPQATMFVENQSLVGEVDGRGSIRFRFCPKDARVFSYKIRSNIPGLDGQSGELTAVAPPPSVALRPSARFPNWWTDDPSAPMAEGVHHGARSVSQWREDILRGFAERIKRCATRNPGK